MEPGEIGARGQVQQLKDGLDVAVDAPLGLHALAHGRAEGLAEGLHEQRRYWPHSTTVLILGTPFVPGGRFHQDYIRCLPPDRSPNELLKHTLADRHTYFDTPEQRWEALPTLLKVFPSFRETAALAAYENQLAQVIATLPGW